MTLPIANDHVVSIHYTLTNVDGEVLDSSEGSDPLQYLHGAGNIIPGLENALVGKQVGEKVDVTVKPEDAYGESMEEMIQEVPREMFQGVDEIEVGMMFQTQSPDGQAQMVTVAAVNDETVTIDANHPLAGQTITFAVEIAEVRESSEEERSHGHVHS
ncbi:FKBP-type peptidyl-prolyl cis-trans isomerase SlyD [BD1-7 clade bacterium]|uniref:Peptidyl-prolyl cis-trans isomerase n=1 Tax=BD1-7 clade bacterium TaxID=2029982 RepID=A0A5S9QZT2_9GAMM|nr:FKBP-type peptidyl-prolyl cis-trans isomerase SlyD [BD1-7 clade bacterium]